MINRLILFCISYITVIGCCSTNTDDAISPPDVLYELNIAVLSRDLAICPPSRHFCLLYSYNINTGSYDCYDNKDINRILRGITCRNMHINANEVIIPSVGSLSKGVIDINNNTIDIITVTNIEMSNNHTYIVHVLRYNSPLSATGGSYTAYILNNKWYIKYNCDTWVS